MKTAKYRLKNFEKGNLYWYMEAASNFPSYAVKGEIFKQYKALNIHFGKLGYPIEEEIDGCQKFQGGEVCTSAIEYNESERLKEIKILMSEIFSTNIPDASWIDGVYSKLRIEIADKSTDQSGIESKLELKEIYKLQEWIKAQQNTNKENLKGNNRKRWFLNGIYVRNLRTLRHQGEITDLEAFAQGAEFISNYWDDSETGRYKFEMDLAVVFSNRDGANCVLSGVGCFGDGTEAQIAYSVFDFGDTGFANYFRDSKYQTADTVSFKFWGQNRKSTNQVFHTMGGGINFGFAGDRHCYLIGIVSCKSTYEWLTWHETEQHKELSQLAKDAGDNHDYKSPHPKGYCGTSWEDLFSSYTGITLGSDLSKSNIKIKNFGHELRYRLGNGKSYDFQTDFIDKVPTGDHYWSINYSQIDLSRMNSYFNADVDARVDPDYCPGKDY